MRTVRTFALLLTVIAVGAVSAVAVAATLNGTEGDDVLFGTSTDDTLNGLGGDDILLGLEGDDQLPDAVVRPLAERQRRVGVGREHGARCGDHG